MDGYGGATTFAPGDPFFDHVNPFDMLGVSPAVPFGGGVISQFPGLARSTGPGGSASAVPPPWSPHSALFWFGGLLAITTGLVALSTSVGARVGKSRAGVALNLGKA